MAKGTVLFLFFLAILAALLLGINLGKKMEKSQTQIAPTPTSHLPPTTLPNLSPTLSSSTSAAVNGQITYTNPTCGYQLTYPQSWIKYESDAKSTAFANSAATDSAKIAIICATEIPKPPLPADKIVNYQLDTVSAKLYHDVAPKDGSALDEIITKIPGKDMEILIAGYGPSLTTILSAFKFLP